MAAITVRRALPTDAATVSAIGRDSYLDHYRDLWQPDALAHWLEQQFGTAAVAAELAGDEVTYLLAESAGAVVGFAKFWHARALPLPPGTTGVELQKIYLRAQALGSGAGAALMDGVLAGARARGAAFVWLDVLVSNTRGVRFYERSGFRIHGERTFEAGAERLPMWVMTHDLLVAAS